MDINIKDEVENLNIEMHKSYNGILLTDSEVKMLKDAGFDIKNYKNIKDLMFSLEEYLLDYENEELEYILSRLAEYNYYNYTTK